jgi:4-diphosphocytidyl-2-C-methyl-D-erythritol kinase
MSDTFSALAPAKLNLTLRVLGRRPDGFHELESLVVRLAWGDKVSVRPAPAGQLTLDVVDDPATPADDSNLVMRAGRVLAEHAGTTAGAHMVLRKRIPPGTGLGGASSDAATTLQLLNRLWKLGLGNEELVRLGTRLGSDVPLFFHRPVCVLRGRGELVEDLDLRLSGHLVLVLPPVACSTPAVYAEWDRLDAHPHRPDLCAVTAALGRPDELMALCFNDLEPAAYRVAPALAELASRISEATGLAVRMTGSGAAFFRVFSTRAAATRFARRVAEIAPVRTIVTAPARKS